MVSGIMTYGLYPSEEVDRSKLELHPALELKSHIAYIKSVGPGLPSAAAKDSFYVKKVHICV